MAYGQGQYQQSGYAAAQLIYPNANGIRGEMKSKGLKPRNHLLDYKMQLKEMQKENRRQKARDQYESSKKKHVLKEFANVPSRLNNKGAKAQSNVEKEPLRERKVTRDFVHNNRVNAFDKHEDHFSNKDNVRTHVKINKDAADTLALLTGGVPAKRINRDLPVEETHKPEKRNYVEENKREATKASVQERKEKQEDKKHKNYGKVPKYLQKRKAAWEQEEAVERAYAAKRAECPPGMKLMEEEERLETLRVLNENKAALQTKLARLPIIIDTLSLRNRKAALEKQMTEIEEAIKMFSRKKVFIAE